MQKRRQTMVDKNNNYFRAPTNAAGEAAATRRATLARVAPDRAARRPTLAANAFQGRRGTLAGRADAPDPGYRRPTGMARRRQPEDQKRRQSTATKDTGRSKRATTNQRSSQPRSKNSNQGRSATELSQMASEVGEDIYKKIKEKMREEFMLING